MNYFKIYNLINNSIKCILSLSKSKFIFIKINIYWVHINLHLTFFNGKLIRLLILELY